MSEQLNIRGLTLIQPWCTAITQGGKRIENRTWPPPSTLVSHGAELWVALHAGFGWDDDALPFIRELWPEAPEGRKAYARGEILAVARVARAVRLGNPPTGGCSYLLRAGETDHKPLAVPDENLGPWAFGPWCWVLEDVRPLLEPVRCKGAMGLWRLERVSWAVARTVRDSVLAPREVAR